MDMTPIYNFKKRQLQDKSNIENGEENWDIVEQEFKNIDSQILNNSRKIEEKLSKNKVIDNLSHVEKGSVLDASRGSELKREIGDLSNLGTQEKTNIVNAINEINSYVKVGKNRIKVVKTSQDTWHKFVAQGSVNTFPISEYTPMQKDVRLLYMNIELIPNKDYTISDEGNVELNFYLEQGEEVDYCVNEVGIDYNVLKNKPDLTLKADKQELSKKISIDEDNEVNKGIIVNKWSNIGVKMDSKLGLMYNIYSDNGVDYKYLNSSSLFGGIGLILDPLDKKGYIALTQEDTSNRDETANISLYEISTNQKNTFKLYPKEGYTILNQDCYVCGSKVHIFAQIKNNKLERKIDKDMAIVTTNTNIHRSARDIVLPITLNYSNKDNVYSKTDVCRLSNDSILLNNYEIFVDTMVISYEFQI